MSNCPIRCNFRIGANPGDCAVRGRLPLGHTLMNPTETCLPLRKRETVSASVSPSQIFLTRHYNLDLQLRQGTTSPPQPPHFIVPYFSPSVHWVTKIIHHSCYFSSLSNCLLFKQKGYLNCYVAQLFMPWHKNACLLLCGKVTHYNPSNFFSPSVWAPSPRVCWLHHAGRWCRAFFPRGYQKITVIDTYLL